MALFEWECLESIINNDTYLMPEASVLYTPAYEVSVKRDSNLQIHLITKCKGNAQANKVKRPLGTVRRNEDNAKLVCKVNYHEIQVKGIASISSKKSRNHHEEAFIKEVSEVYSVEGNFKNLSSGKYLFEWIQNMDVDYYHWPRTVKYKSEDKLNLILNNEDREISFSAKGSENNSGQDAVRLTVDGHELWVSKINDKKSDDSCGRGFILYIGCPSENVRKRLRNCISFALGRPLIYLGNTVLDSKYSLVSFYSVSAYSFDGKASKLPTTPPVFLGVKWLHELNEIKLHRLVNALYKVYLEYDLDFIFWQYWHAVCSSIHSAPVQFGASIEALRTSLLEKNQIETSVVSKSDWKYFQEKMRIILDDWNIDEGEKSIIRNKLGSLNQAPQRIITERFYQFLGLEFTDTEKGSWNRRNIAAHGQAVEEDDYIDLIRDVKVLRIIFHRIVLKISGGSDDYIDYFSLEHPIRKIEEGVPPEKV
jgi:hypothetical protein